MCVLTSKHACRHLQTGYVSCPDATLCISCGDPAQTQAQLHGVSPVSATRPGMGVTRSAFTSATLAHSPVKRVWIT